MIIYWGLETVNVLKIEIRSDYLLSKPGELTAAGFKKTRTGHHSESSQILKIYENAVQDLVNYVMISGDRDSLT